MYLFLICLVFINKSESARILGIFPTPSISHQVAFRPLTLELAKRGHELVVLTPNPVFAKGQSPENYTEIDVHELSYGIWRNTFLKEKPGTLFEQILQGFCTINQIFVQQILSEDFQRIMLSDKKFDLLIIESFMKPAWILGYIFKAPIVLMSSYAGLRDVYEMFGASTHPTFYPPSTQKRLNNLTFFGKLEEFYSNYHVDRMWQKVDEHDKKTVESIFGTNVPEISEMVDSVALLILNMHSIWDNNRPVAPNVVYVGGIHQIEHKELPTVSYLDTVLRIVEKARKH